MKIALIGYGKMGHEIELVAKERGHTVLLRIQEENQHELTLDNLSKVDVAIEFSSPHSAKQNVETCIAANTPVVSGTTGWMNDLNSIISKVKMGAGTLFYASNYSIGVNIFFKANALVSKLLEKTKGYSVSIQEIHHTQKLDAPSGTAISLANIIAEESSLLSGWTLLPNREDKKIPIESIREGVVSGTHIVKFESEQDQIVLSHIAKSRRGFAVGAVLAAEFIVGKKGFFTMNDLLKF